MMRVLISVADGAESGELAEFASWLQETRSVSRVAEVTLETEHETGTMSAGDVIVLASTAVSALSGALSAYAAWRASRQQPAPALNISVNGAAGVVVSTGSAAELALLTRTSALPTPAPETGEATTPEVEA